MLDCFIFLLMRGKRCNFDESTVLALNYINLSRNPIVNSNLRCFLLIEA